jgi:hypothetical protein
MSLRLLRVCLFISFGVSYPPANADEARPPYKFLRYDEDYSFLSDPTQRTDLFDWVKYIPLDGAGYLSFGGEVRERFETYNNEEFSPNPNADMPTCYSVTFSTPITIRPTGCGFSGNCKVHS